MTLLVAFRSCVIKQECSLDHHCFAHLTTIALYVTHKPWVARVLAAQVLL